jgi:hypothetical protein
LHQPALNIGALQQEQFCGHRKPVIFPAKPGLDARTKWLGKFGCRRAAEGRQWNIRLRASSENSKIPLASCHFETPRQGESKKWPFAARRSPRRTAASGSLAFNCGRKIGWCS